MIWLEDNVRKTLVMLVNDTVAKPLFDRALQAEYSPGSPFKTLNALIGLQENSNYFKYSFPDVIKVIIMLKMHS